MQVIMTVTTKGSRDGVTVTTFEAGQVYDLPDALATAFTDMGVADRYRPIVDAETPETPNRSVKNNAETSETPKRNVKKWNS